MERIALISTILFLVGCNQTIPLVPEFPKVPELLIREEFPLKTIEQYRLEKPRKADHVQSTSPE